MVRLEGHLQQDVDFGWGILGRLNKGGWIVIEQADVGPDMGIGQWRTVRFQMQMSGRVVFKNRIFDTTEEETGYAPLPSGIGLPESDRRCCSPESESSGKHEKSGPMPVASGRFFRLMLVAYFTLMMIMAKVNRVSDSMKARPMIMKVIRPARVPGLRARASVVEPTALP